MNLNKQVELGYEWFKSLPEDEKLLVAKQLIRGCLWAKVVCWRDEDKEMRIPPYLYWESTGDPLSDPES